MKKNTNIPALTSGLAFFDVASRWQTRHVYKSDDNFSVQKEWLTVKVDNVWAQDQISKERS